LSNPIKQVVEHSLKVPTKENSEMTDIEKLEQHPVPYLAENDLNLQHHWTKNILAKVKVRPMTTSWQTICPCHLSPQWKWTDPRMPPTTMTWP